MFTPHDVHAAEPLTDFHSPPTHGVHSSPSAPVYPARQVHDVIRVLDAVEKVLSGQRVHSVPLAPLYPARQVQDVSRLLDAAENVLSGHGEQEVDATAATSVEYVDALHDVHATEPVADFHLPAAQGVHAVPSAPVYPARQVHDVSIALFDAAHEFVGHAEQNVAAVANVYVFISQCVHTALPVTFLYVPAAQGVHAVPSAPVYPARHVQDASTVLLAAEKVLFGHTAQCSAADNE